MGGRRSEGWKDGEMVSVCVEMGLGERYRRSWVGSLVVGFTYVSSCTGRLLGYDNTAMSCRQLSIIQP